MYVLPRGGIYRLIYFLENIAFAKTRYRKLVIFKSTGNKQSAHANGVGWLVSCFGYTSTSIAIQVLPAPFVCVLNLIAHENQYTR